MNAFSAGAALCIWAVILSVLIAAQAIAQTPADVNAAQRQADQVQRTQQEQLRQGQPQPGAPSGTVAAPPTVATRGDQDQQCFNIRRIHVTGAQLIEPDDISSAVQPFENKCLDLVGLNNVLQQITFLYVSRGFVASRAYLPEQDIGDNNLEVVVVEGELTDIVVNGEPEAHQGKIATAFPGLKGKPLNLRDVEQGLDQINRLRSRNATVKLEPGSAQGKTQLNVEENTGKPWHVTVGADNLGSEASGEYQRTAGLEVDNVLGLNDRLTFNIQESVSDKVWRTTQDEPYGQLFSGSFSIPYGYWLFSLDASKSRYFSTIEGTTSDIETSGESYLVNAYVDRVVHRDQTSKTNFTGGFTFKDNDTFILGSLVDVSSRKLSIGSIGFSHARQAAGGLLAGTVTYNQGLDILGAFDDDTAPEGSPKGQFRKITGSLSFTRPFTVGSVSLVYNGYATVEWGVDALFGSEQTAFGSYSSVRGLSEPQVFGNRSVLWRNDLGLRLPAVPDQPELTSWFGQLEPYIGLDVGKIFSQDDLGIPGVTLNGAVAGVRTQGGQLSLDVSYAELLRFPDDREDIKDANGTVYARVSTSF